MKVTIVSLLFALPALAVAQTNIDPIDQRQKAFSQIEDVAKQANKTLNGSSTDWALLIEQSETLYKNSHTLSSLFPEGSDTGSKAKSDIWLKPEKAEGAWVAEGPRAHAIISSYPPSYFRLICFSKLKMQKHRVLAFRLFFLAGSRAAQEGICYCCKLPITAQSARL